jgi:hypothetical protein
MLCPELDGRAVGPATIEFQKLVESGAFDLRNHSRYRFAPQNKALDFENFMPGHRLR